MTLVLKQLRRRDMLATDDDSDDMLGSIEEIEFGDNESLDQHDRARSDDSQECDNIDDSDDIQHNVTSAGQRLAKASHFEIDA